MKWIGFFLTVLLSTSFVAAAQEVVSGMLPVTEGNLYFETMGKGPAIVFTHGGFGDRRMWNNQFEEFAKQYRVVRYDHRGFGKSHPPKAAYSPVADLEALLDHLKIDKAHVVGNSMGGAVAIDFALLKPSRVASLTVVASGPNGLPVPKEDMDRMNAVFHAAQKEGLNDAVELWIKNPMVAVTSQLSSTADLLRTMIRENASIFLMEFWPIEKLDPAAAKRLDKIKVPVLIILGDKDTKVVLDIGEAAATGIKGAKKELIPGADHLPQMDDPGKFNRILADFVKGVISPGQVKK